MLTIAFFIGIAVVCYIVKHFLNKKEDSESPKMGDQEHVRCSSSESDNFEKIDSDDVKVEENEKPSFVVGEEIDDEPANEGGDFFPNVPPPNLRPKLTTVQQLALAEKRSKLRYQCFVFKKNK